MRLNPLRNAGGLKQRLKLKLNAVWLAVRFGRITEEIKGFAGDHVVAEVEYRGRGGRIIGYWAYGSFDPTLPYQG